MALMQYGKLLFSPLVGAASWYARTAKARPLATAVVTTGVKTSAADLFAQKVVEGREDFDLRRHLCFTAFGFCYLGGFQYWLYNIKFTQWCGPLQKAVGHMGTAPLKTFFDQAIHHPLLYFPCFYALKATVEGRSLASAAQRYRDELWDNLRALWMVWVPAQAVNFAFVPRHLRIPYVALVSFGWTVILSTMQSSFDKKLTAKQSEVLQQGGSASGTPLITQPAPSPASVPLAASSFAASAVLRQPAASAAQPPSPPVATSAAASALAPAAPVLLQGKPVTAASPGELRPVSAVVADRE